MLARARHLLVVGLFAALGSSACARDGDLIVRKVLIDVAPGAEGPGAVLERESVRALVSGVLANHRGVRLAPADADAAVLRVRVESATLTPGQDEEPARGSVAVALEASGRARGGARYHYQSHSVASSTGDVSFPTILRQAVADCLAQILNAQGAQAEPSEALLSWLEDEQRRPEERRHAARLLGARRERRAVVGLVRALEGDDKDLAQAALGALTLIGDPSAVDAVIRYASGKPSHVRKQAIEAVRVMGTRRGAAWLFTMSTGHRDPDVQAAAAAALAQVELRLAEGAQAEPRVAETRGEEGNAAIR